MPGGPSHRLAAWTLAAIATAIAALIVYLMLQYPEALSDRGSKISLTHQFLWLGLLLSSFAVRWRTSPGETLRNAAIWVAIAAAIGALYSLRHEFESLGQRMLFELMPHRGQIADNRVTFRARDSGHFVVEAQVDGTALRLMVDTGATDLVLSPSDAQRLGFDLSTLNFTRAYNTANGTVRGAPVRLRHIALGPIQLNDVRASVNQAPMNTSLLGMSFLSRLSSYEVNGDTLTLVR
jgi:aspartyl protease family protein